ncbi:FkbM family methyltransferase [Roseococcus microcysteis]|uniref:FkbM family methyltransferase n=1 Tax=Roseococcus microcysteis TaxID=2771361 RepID=UPI00168B7F5A|nr:FkbM family methyltransferase [Roseococcus microcysteis]
MNAASQTPVAQTDMVAAVRWAYRLVLGRDPESDKVIANWASLQDPQAVLRHLARSGEAAEVAATNRPLIGTWPDAPLDAEAIRATGLLLHGTLPAPEEVEATLQLCPTGTALREAFLDSAAYAAARDGREAPVPVEAAPQPLPPHSEAEVTLDGRRLRIRGQEEDAYWSALRHGVVESSVISLLRVTRAHLAGGGQGAVLMDVGANIGLASLAMAQAAPGHAVLLAIEPNAANAGHLRHNLAANGLPRARVEEMALGARGGEAEFMADARNSATGHLVAHEAAAAGAGRTVRRVPVQRLDRLLADHGCERLDVLKVDVEGGEDEVLAGAGDLLARYRTLVHIEFNLWTIMAMAGANPRRVLENWAAAFPHIVAFGDDGNPAPLKDNALLMWFLYVTTTKRGGMGDLVLCHDLEWLKRWK